MVAELAFAQNGLDIVEGGTRPVRTLILAALGLLLAVSAGPAAAERRLALVVGNGAYQHTTALANPANDAADMAGALKATGFEVIQAVNADKRRLDAFLRAFADKLAGADVALFYYAGHGLQVGLQNYLIPVDAKLERERDLEFEAVKLDFVLRQMEIDREGKTTIVMLDACRDNPLSRNLARSMGTRSTAIGRGLAPASTGLGTFIAYATQPGNVALDGEGMRNSPFTTALLKHVPARGRNLPATMIEVRKDVVQATSGRQVPWDHSALTGDFYFVPGAAAATVANTPATTTSFDVRGGWRIEGDTLPAPPSTANCETRCQSEPRCIGWHLSRDGICELFSRIAKQAEDVRFKSGVRPGASAPIAVAAAPIAAPPILPRGGGEAPSLAYSLEDGVRIAGNRMAENRQPNPEACRQLCATTTGCAAYQHGKKVPVMGQCQLFDRVDGRQEDANWRSGVRVVADNPVLIPPALLLGSERPVTERGFTAYDNAEVEGDVIKSGRADTLQACRALCRNTAGCIAAHYKSDRGRNQACTALKSVSGARPGVKGSTALFKTEAGTPAN